MKVNEALLDGILSIQDKLAPFYEGTGDKDGEEMEKMTFGILLGKTSIKKIGVIFC